MPRSVRSPRTPALAVLFGQDPEAAVLRVLRRGKRAMTAIEVKAALQAGGVSKADADRAWPGVQRRLRKLDQVAVENGTYRWSEASEQLTPGQALQSLAAGGLAAGRRAALVELVREALDRRGVDAETAARLRQAEIDGVRALAELAIEVEELTANDASSRAMIHRIRARMRRTGLEPIEQVGEATRFDRERHKPIGKAIDDGAKVVVVRPGYVWKGPAEELVISKAVVQE